MSLATKIFRTKKIQKTQKQKKKLQLQFRYAPLKSYKAAFINLRRRWLYHSFASQQYEHFVRNPTSEKKKKKTAK